MTERINITVPADLLAEIDKAAEREHLTRSGFLRAAARERLARAESTGWATAANESVATYAPLRRAGSGARQGPRRDGGTWPPSRETALSTLRAFFAARDDVAAAYLFGSTAAECATHESDIDVAVLFGEEADPDTRFSSQLDLAGRIGALFGADRVDVVVLDDAPPHLAAAVVDEGIVVAGEHSGRRARFERDVRSGAAEHDRELEQGWREFSDRIARGGGTG